ncbi:MAG: hypothetical protein IPK76_14505 [Lewinellaceae bacterium]|nr:hypothetical protein [Lewinellaceae bacterium]
MATLCTKRGLKAPVGYAERSKFIKEFIKSGGGYTGALTALKDSLSDNALTNIGIIIDANDQGPTARWQSIRAILAEKYDPATLLAADAQTGPKIIIEAGMPTIGVWIMPDNANPGYLEHFLASLVPAGNALWTHANDTINDLVTKPINELTVARKQKALLYTWLAWKKDPGKPFGLAIHSGYFNHNAPTVQPFIDWFAQTFN